jgi:Zn-dependent M28 family amino/carboxypeptidase
MKPAALLGLSLSAVTSLAWGAPADVQREALSNSHAYGFVRSLCDEVGPRLAGSPADKAAVAWAQRTMREAGLANVHTEPVKVTHWERGEARAEIVGQGSPSLPLTVAALGGSVSTPARGIDANVVEAENIAELKKLDDASVRGKIVFLDPKTRRARDGRGYGESVGNRHSGAREAAAKGAVALLLRSIGTDSDRLPHTGAKGKDDHEIPALALAAPDAELLHRVLAERKTARVHLSTTSRTLPDADGANVVGEVLGRERPNEVVLIGAHLDSWDLGTGAIDDGAGVAIALETARVVAAMPEKPRRTVRVVLFANEEHGLEGAKGYAKAHAAEAGSIVVAMEADFGADAVYAVRFRGDPAARDRFTTLARALAPLGIAREDEPAFGGADVSPLMALGVPVLDLRQDGTRYFDFHHTANDTVDKIDPATLAVAAAAFATAVREAADMEGDFGRIPEDQRKQRF